MASDEPRYVVADTPPDLLRENIEIRIYEKVLIASVRVQGPTWRDASGSAFRPLANYIFGSNDKGEQIGMTSPVTTHQFSDNDDLWEVRFFMPHRYDRATLPMPESPYIQIEEQDETRFAVIRFSGHARAQKGVENFAKYEAKLRNALRDAGIKSDGKMHYAVYDGPWTPAILRRNEVFVSLN